MLKRTTTMTYDTAGRPTQIQTDRRSQRKHLDPGGRNHLQLRPPAHRKASSSSANHPKSCTGFDNQEVKTTYDKLGRPIEYLDADGNKSGVAYDFIGPPRACHRRQGRPGDRPTTKNQASPTKLVDSAAGTFTAAYNANGQMTEQVLPNGLAQQITYDPEGSP